MSESGIFVFFADFAPPSLLVRDALPSATHIDVSKQDATKYKVEFVPTVLALYNGKEISRVDKYDMTLINTLVSDYKQFLKLKDLTESSRIVAFIKGSKNAPRCGFTRTLLELLDGVEYSTVDVLSDPFVREWMKVYSDWPTFPQVYVDGEFVGGLDIIQQMDGEEFNSTFK